MSMFTPSKIARKRSKGRASGSTKTRRQPVRSRVNRHRDASLAGSNPDAFSFIDYRSRITSTKRVRLKGADMSNLRWQAFHRAGGRCEKLRAGKICKRSAPWDGHELSRGHLAHNEHGYRKSDELSRVKWSCGDCHRAEHGLRKRDYPQLERRT